MFDENFSFEPLRSPSLDSLTATASRDSSRSISPCTSTGAFPTPHFTVTDLAAQFASQRIQRQSQICYDSCQTYSNGDDDEGWVIPALDECEGDQLQRAQTFPQRSQSPSRRAQRQVNTRLLCSTSHRRDIAALVERMVDEEEQCSITPAESLTPPPEEDEGYNSSDEPMTETSRRSSVATMQSRFEIRRASDLRISSASVNKRVRLRSRRHRRGQGPETAS